MFELMIFEVSMNVYDFNGASFHCRSQRIFGGMMAGFFHGHRFASPEIGWLIHHFSYHHIQKTRFTNINKATCRQTTSENVARKHCQKQ